MVFEPRIWVKIKPLNEPHTLSRTEFDALKIHIGALVVAGIDVISGNEKNWTCGVSGFSKDWLSEPYLAKSMFRIGGVLVYTKCLREAHRDGKELVGKIKSNIGNIIDAGIKVGGGERGVELIFRTVEEFNAWADSPLPEFPRKNPPAPFCPYPRQPDAGRNS